MQISGINTQLKALRDCEAAKQKAEEAGEAFDEEVYKTKTVEMIDIEELKTISVREYLENMGVKITKTASQRKMCCCPIHDEKDPSFIIYENNNSFYCFGCGKGGSIIDLVMNIQKIDLKEAIKVLCNEYKGLTH